MRYAYFLDLQVFARPNKLTLFLDRLYQASSLDPIATLVNISNLPEAIFPPVLMDLGAGRMDLFFARRVYAPTVISRIIGRKH